VLVVDMMVRCVRRTTWWRRRRLCRFRTTLCRALALALGLAAHFFTELVVWLVVVVVVVFFVTTTLGFGGLTPGFCWATVKAAAAATTHMPANSLK